MEFLQCTEPDESSGTLLQKLFKRLLIPRACATDLDADHDAKNTPVIVMAEERSYLSAESPVMVLRAPSSRAAREAVRRIGLASENKGPCLPNVFGLLEVAEAHLKKEAETPDDIFLVSSTPSFIWKEPFSVNELQPTEYVLLLTVCGQELMIGDYPIMRLGRKMSLSLFLKNLEGLAECLDSTSIAPEEQTDYFVKEQKDSEEKIELSDLDSIFDTTFEQEINKSPCISFVTKNGLNQERGINFKIFFKNEQDVDEFCRRIESPTLPQNRNYECTLNVNGLCTGRPAKYHLQPEIYIHESVIIEGSGTSIFSISDSSDFIPSFPKKGHNKTFTIRLMQEDDIVIFIHQTFYEYVKIQRSDLLSKLQKLREIFAKESKDRI